MTKLTREQKSLNYELSGMTTGDLDQVAQIESSCFSNPWPRESFRHDLSDRRAYTLVAKEGEKVLAYLVAYIIEEELQIANIAVRAEHRRRGIGERLLAEALSRGRKIGCRYAVLDVRPSNSAAAQLYSKFGFSLAGHRPWYYADPSENALIMTKDLS
jgi:ribosomal-protein-alanine N-acetyltransferase